MLSDHKPVAALLSILLPTGQGIRELVMKPVHQPWIKSKSMKLHIRHTGMGKLSPVTSGHWVGLYKSGWVNKASYFSWAYVQKKKKPKGSSQPKGPWVNICRKVDGKHPPCGRSDTSKGAYPKCRAAGVASKMSDSQKRSACQQKRTAEKKDPQRGKGQKPVMTSYKPRKK